MALKYFLDNYDRTWGTVLDNDHSGYPRWKYILDRLPASFSKASVEKSRVPAYMLISILNNDYINHPLATFDGFLTLVESLGLKGDPCIKQAREHAAWLLVPTFPPPAPAPVSRPIVEVPRNRHVVEIMETSDPANQYTSPSKATPVSKVILFIPSVARAVKLMEKLLMLFNKDAKCIEVVTVGNKPSKAEKKGLNSCGNYIKIIQPTFSGQLSTKFFSVMKTLNDEQPKDVAFVYVTQDLEDDVFIFEVFGDLSKSNRREYGILPMNDGFPYWFAQRFPKLDYTKNAQEVFCPNQDKKTLEAFKKTLKSRLPTKCKPEDIWIDVAGKVENEIESYLDYKDALSLEIDTLNEVSIKEEIEHRAEIKITDLNEEFPPPEALRNIGGWLIVFLMTANCEKVGAVLEQKKKVYYLVHQD